MVDVRRVKQLQRAEDPTAAAKLPIQSKRERVKQLRAAWDRDFPRLLEEIMKAALDGDRHAQKMVMDRLLPVAWFEEREGDDQGREQQLRIIHEYVDPKGKDGD